MWSYLIGNLRVIKFSGDKSKSNFSCIIPQENKILIQGLWRPYFHGGKEKIGRVSFLYLAAFAMWGARRVIKCPPWQLWAVGNCKFTQTQKKIGDLGRTYCPHVIWCNHLFFLPAMQLLLISSNNIVIFLAYYWECPEASQLSVCHAGWDDRKESWSGSPTILLFNWGRDPVWLHLTLSTQNILRNKAQVRFWVYLCVYVYGVESKFILFCSDLYIYV